jgi:hypothetical protein
MCDQIAPVFRDIPGLQSKVWLADPETNTYGGVYSWHDRAAMEAYGRGDLFKSVLNHPNFTAITAHDYDVLDGPTRVTHGLAMASA